MSYRIIDAGRRGVGIEGLPALLDWAEHLGFDGLNVTHPFKQAVVPLLDDLSEDAEDLGAVNTVVFRDGRRLGRQHRLVRLQPRLPAARWAAPSTTASCWSEPAAPGSRSGTGCWPRARRTSRCTTSTSRAPTTAPYAWPSGTARTGSAWRSTSRPHSRPPRGSSTPPRSACTAIPGSAVPEELLREDLWVADVVYFPLETELVAAARTPRMPGDDRRRHGRAAGRHRVRDVHRASRPTPSG